MLSSEATSSAGAVALHRHRYDHSIPLYTFRWPFRAFDPCVLLDRRELHYSIPFHLMNLCVQYVSRTQLNVRDLIDAAKDYHLTPSDRRAECLAAQTFRVRPRCAAQTCAAMIFAVGGFSPQTSIAAGSLLFLCILYSASIQYMRHQYTRAVYSEPSVLCKRNNHTALCMNHINIE